ncbi:non-heme iron oxygenase ferredoxin subunit [Frankia sp. Cppng1_Ct_nod]|uniref:non-heme iron oxygenase ferredoxin subunit n=1 Tax=Frankia sp. Cppng1_Ct_nod TaxID=2897162 RepID=UPI001F5E4216|nr:non-heme iron oxygenase ferredoxin subunit [Frankia sp. Cppng1_Ct_nod]
MCALSDLSEEAAFGVEVDGQPVCLALAGGQVYAIRDECSHADVMLSHGEVENRKIECWLHGSQFDLETGEPIGLPATEPVPVYPVKIDGDDVLVDVGQS